MTKLQLQNLAWTSTSKSWSNFETLCSKSEQKLYFMTKLHLPNLHQSVVNAFLIINMSNNNDNNANNLLPGHFQFSGQDGTGTWKNSGSDTCQALPKSQVFFAPLSLLGLLYKAAHFASLSIIFPGIIINIFWHHPAQFLPLYPFPILQNCLILLQNL